MPVAPPRNGAWDQPPAQLERNAITVTRFGLQIPSFTYPGVADRDPFDRVADVAGAAEHSGFDSVRVMDPAYQIANVV